MSRVIPLNSGTVDLGQAPNFYRDVSAGNHEFPGPEEYWAVKTMPDNQPGINGGIMRHKRPHATNREYHLGRIHGD